jgi:hypothetical protein
MTQPSTPLASVFVQAMPPQVQAHLRDVEHPNMAPWSAHLCERGGRPNPGCGNGSKA